MMRWLLAFLALGAVGLGAASLTIGARAQGGGSAPSGAQVLADMATRRTRAPTVTGYAPTATSTPTATPTPLPSAFTACYGERRGDASQVELRPASPKSLFANCQVVAYYGYPGIPGLGVLGQGEPAAMVTRLATEAAAHDAVNGARSTVPAVEVIAAIAQRAPGDDRTYLSRIPIDLLDQQIAFARERNLLVILDLQMGRSTVDAELAPLLPYLADPRVHLALDPEWAMPEGVAPGDIIGGMDASAINRAQEIVSQWLAEHRAPTNKILVVHQFTESMIRHKEDLRPFPGVDLVIDMDGFGGQGAKIGNYGRFVGEDAAPHGGIKLFYEEDTDLLSPARVNAISPQPDLIVYQ